MRTNDRILRAEGGGVTRALVGNGLLQGLYQMGKKGVQEGKYVNKYAGVPNELQKQGFDKIEGLNPALGRGAPAYDDGRGYVTQALRDNYGINSQEVSEIRNALKPVAKARMESPPDAQYGFTDIAQQKLKEIPAGRKALKKVGKDSAYFNKRNGINKGNEIDFYRQQIAPPSSGISFENPQFQTAPGSASTQIKIKSPTQAEQVSAGMASTRAPQRVSDVDRVKLGDKDMRSFLAEQKLRVAQDLAGGGYSRDQLVDMLNQPGVQVGEQFSNSFAGDETVQRAFQLGEEGALMRPEFETSDFVGEGQFGRVRELAPGYVVKDQAPLVEFAGYRTDGSGNQTGNPRGKNLVGRGGTIKDYRDVAEEVDQLKYLNKKGAITPGVEAFNINDDGSTEVIMRDLRENFEGGNEYYERLNEQANSGDAKVQAQAMKDARVFEVKRRQQEAAAAMAGVELQDRHEGNVMRHKMTGRPLQIDPSGRRVSGVDRTIAISEPVVDAFYKAGLTDEAQIFEGLLSEAANANDYDTYKDLVQQGASRVMKMKNVVDADEYTSLLGV